MARCLHLSEEARLEQEVVNGPVVIVLKVKEPVIDVTAWRWVDPNEVASSAILRNDIGDEVSLLETGQPP